MIFHSILLGNHCVITSSKRFHLSERAQCGVPFYRSKEIIQMFEGNDVSICDYISNNQYEKIAETFGVPKENDILLTTRGTIGIPYLCSADDRFYFADGNLTWMKDFDDELYPQYLYYWFLSHTGQKQVDAIAVGTAQKAVPISGLSALELAIPSLTVQRRIVEILSAYDNLARKNRKQIKLLEEAAARLYKEWFVDLRFPGYETTKFVDGLPEGWANACFNDICVLVKDCVSPKDILPNTPYIGLEHMPRKSICLNEWIDASIVNSNKFIFRVNDILFGKIRPYFHKVGFAQVDGVASTDAIILRAKQDMFGLLLMTASSDVFVKYTYTTCKEGSKMPRADWDEMKAYRILIPDPKVLKMFDEQIRLMTQMIKTKSMQSLSLCQARDKLLPKLMSGEIEV